MARLVGYDTARPNFYTLNEIPRRLSEHAERLAQEIEGEVERRALVERAALEAAGVKSLEDALDGAEKDLAQATSRLSQAKAQLSKLDRDQVATSEMSTDYIRAVETLVEGLGRQDLRTLYQQALQTPTPEDERIVLQLQEGEQAIARTEAQIGQIRQAAVQLASKRAELERSQGNFRQSGYDNSRGGFINGDLIGSILGGIIAGSLSSSNFSDALREGYRQRQSPPSGGFGGGLRLPQSRPGGGFRTGGGF